jgi:TPR repeat protein
MYLEGQGVEKSKEKAMECFQQSTNEMNSEECYRQGMVFYNERRYDISLLYIRKAVETGYSLAQFRLGVMLLEGKGFQKNQPEALNWIAKSLESMTPNNCYDQGMALYRGTTVVKDYALSFRFMEKAAEKHHGLAQAQLGLAYFYGLGVVKNKDEAMKWVEQSMKELNADEYYEQGMKFYNGIEVDQDNGIALLYIQKAAESYHGPSQAQLALMHLEGRGVVKNYDTAMYWIEKSMNGLKLTECYRQGMLFYHRKRLENNYDIALRYFKKASKADAYAQAQLGYMYLNGIGVDQDHEEAARWHGMVENNYIGDSRYCRSKIHHYDQNGMQNFSKALKLYQEELRFMEYDYGDDYDYDFANDSDYNWDYGYRYLKSAGCCGAMRGIGLLYEYGDGVTQDSKKALKYYGRSASDKNTAAYYDIGLLYYYGKGVDQNYKEAFIYFTKLANSIPDPKKLHVFIEENNDDAKDMTGSSKRAYSLLPEGRIYGEAHYYIGLMYNNGFFVDQDEERARNYFKMAYIHGVERAKKRLFK